MYEIIKTIGQVEALLTKEHLIKKKSETFEIQSALCREELLRVTKIKHEFHNTIVYEYKRNKFYIVYTNQNVLLSFKKGVHFKTKNKN
jgi:hypothetical protein